MHHRSLDEITQIATIQPAPVSARMIRRQRLNRLADLLSAYSGPIQLLTQIEFCPVPERHAARAEYSPLALAYADAQFRREGLAGDTLGDAIGFFSLTEHQAHRLFCSCHYAYPAEPQAIAARVRAVANALSLRERWERTLAWFGRG